MISKRKKKNSNIKKKKNLTKIILSKTKIIWRKTKQKKIIFRKTKIINLKKKIKRKKKNQTQNLKTDHDWTKRSQMVIKQSCFSNVTGLECKLEATAAHSKAHGIHINVIRFGCRFCFPIVSIFRKIFHKWGQCVFVFEDCSRKKKSKMKQVY